MSSAGRENLDVDHVARYDEKEDADAAAAVALLVELGLDGRSQVVDLGAGTGQFTLAVAPSCARVVAVDISPLMLKTPANPAGTAIAPHTHPTDNVGVITKGELILTVSGPNGGDTVTFYGPGDWYNVPADTEHAARFDTDSAEIEFWFNPRLTGR